MIFNLCLFFNIHAQKSFAEVDQKISKIPSQQTKSIATLSQWINGNFNTDVERLRANYFWVTNHLSYDLRMTREQSQNLSLQTMVQKAFVERKAVCEGYAGLMDSICKLTGIQSLLVSGYVRINGQLDPTPHVWVAAFVGGKWTLSDPTFGSGAIINNKYVKEFDPQFFMVTPKKMIETHMPYDPLLQFLDNPLMHSDFINKKENLSEKKTYFNFDESLKIFLQSTTEERYRAELDRISQQNYTHPAIDQRVEFLEASISIFDYNHTIGILTEISQKFNMAVSSYNAFANLFNQQQRNPDKKQQLKFLNEASVQLDEAENMLNNLSSYPQSLQNQVFTIRKSIAELRDKIEKSKM